MEKQYRHKRTGRIVKKVEHGYFVERNIGVLPWLPNWVVESSDDWEEIKPVLYLSREGQEITDPQQWITLVWPTTLSRSGMSVDLVKSQPPGWIMFSDSINAEEYIKRNKKIFSEQDVLDAMDKIVFQHQKLFSSFRELLKELKIDVQPMG